MLNPQRKLKNDAKRLGIKEEEYIANAIYLETYEYDGSVLSPPREMLIQIPHFMRLSLAQLEQRFRVDARGLHGLTARCGRITALHKAYMEIR